MPFYPPFNMPFFYNNYRYPRNLTSSSNSSQKKEAINLPQDEKISASANYNYETSYKNQKQYTSKYNNKTRQKASKNYYSPEQKASENYYKQKEIASENYNDQEKKASENSKKNENPESLENREISEFSEVSEAFFEIFGLKLYFDDILIMCILFFLYTEKVHDDELFICLILLLLT